MQGGTRNTQESEGGNNLPKDMAIITVETNLGTIRIL
jgi:hypothetical protein|tara:strand:- start:195 stop:305 length:111 start_codon:yes stop_codon:yes gene_type:complete